MNRRDHIKTMLSLAVWPYLFQQPASLLQRQIPGSDAKLPVLGMGTWRTFDVGDNVAGRNSRRIVMRNLLSSGASLVDSSPMYGSSQRVVGDISTELDANQQLFIATKVWISGREAGISQMKRTMQELKRQRIELMQIHNLVDWRTHVKTLLDWKAQGIIQYTGVTHYHAGSYNELEVAMKTKQFDFVQVNYSLGELQSQERILPLAQELGMGVIINRPFQEGSLFHEVSGKKLPDWAAELNCKSWAQFFLKFIISHPAVTCAIPATTNPTHMLENMSAGTGSMPDEKTRRKMVSAFHA